MEHGTHLAPSFGVKPQKVGLEQLKGELSTTRSEQEGRRSRRDCATVGRQVLNNEGLEQLAESIEQEGIKFLRYTPAVVFASEYFLRQSLHPERFRERAEAYLDDARSEVPRLSLSSQVVTNGLKKDLQPNGTLEVGIMLADDAETTMLEIERKFIREKLQPGSSRTDSLSPVFVRLGMLQIASAGHAIDIPRLSRDAVIPDELTLDMVDVFKH